MQNGEYDEQELATMINKGKGKLKWERDMPRDIEEKLEVINMMVIVIVMVGKGNFVRKTNSCFFITTLLQNNISVTVTTAVTFLTK